LTQTNSYGDDSPIAAFATTPGNSALTIIRCSGKGSIEAAASVFSKPEKLKQAAGNTVFYDWITYNGEKIDAVLVSIFRSPKSFTAEDSLDISCHGGSSAGKAVMAALKAAGFRNALPGEFTFRAFMNGKIDLTKSESVMELVSAKTDTGRQHAISRLSGSLEKEINEIKSLLVQALAAAEIYLDYSEDEIGSDTDEEAGILPNKNIALQAMARIKKLSDSWQLERIYQEGVTLVIAGRPNAGKSSLFNLLLKEDRSIVTETPGTTRDWIEALVSIDGIPVRLVDTAGLRNAVDSVEKIGVERSRKLLQDADIVLYLLDGTQGFTEEDNAECKALGEVIKNKSVLILWNKSDIIMPPEPFPVSYYTPICISAKTGEGLDSLYRTVTSSIFSRSSDMPSDISLGTVRQKDLIDEASSYLDEALVLSENEEPLDLIAPLLREAVNSLGKITGEVSSADILEEMFSRFCVGK
jgi:tRNA modification GTPase